ENLVRFVASSACKGLSYAHAKGLVHHDIKSGNIMLTKTRELKLMDFGLAKFVEESRADHTQAIGTPYYISPEQILGEALDGRSDIYSLGVTLFELSTGQVPFAKGDLTYHHLHTPPPIASNINPDVSESISEIVFRCMQKDPDDRFQDVEAIIEALKSNPRST
ncbi:MAG: serine/threonine protein kinase, partial [Myxococcales bacterium]|nr:serine/threonine protein kinase [Myxococcales bacterium]